MNSNDEALRITHKSHNSQVIIFNTEIQKKASDSSGTTGGKALSFIMSPAKTSLNLTDHSSNLENSISPKQ